MGIVLSFPTEEAGSAYSRVVTSKTLVVDRLPPTQIDRIVLIAGQNQTLGAEARNVLDPHRQREGSLQRQDRERRGWAPRVCDLGVSQMTWRGGRFKHMQDGR